MTHTEVYDLVIVGSGPGGYAAAVRAAELGLRTACIEKEPKLGGICLNVGCIPSKALLESSDHYRTAADHFADHGILTGTLNLDLAAMMARKDHIVNTLTDQVEKGLRGHNVDIIYGRARLAGRDRVEVLSTAESPDANASRMLRTRAILLAAGSEPVSLPGMTFDHNRIVDSTGALSFDEVPTHLGIIGGGYIGLELGSVWRRLGAQVSIMDLQPNLTPSLDGQIARQLERELRNQGIEFHLSTRIISAERSERFVSIEFETKDSTSHMECDRLLIAVGRQPLTRHLGLEKVGIIPDDRSGRIPVDETFQTRIPGIYAIGDLIAGPMLAHKASAEGIAAVECMAGMAGEVNYDTLPSVVYTSPEVAGAGLTEEQAKNRRIDYKTATCPFSGIGRALCMGESRGLFKIIAHARTDRVLGVHIIGPHASDLIAECVLAMEFGGSAEDIARTVHSHPTLSEGLQEAARRMAASKR